jgi:hypothetical protein
MPFHLCLGLPSSLFPSGFQTEILNAFLLSLTPPTCPSYLTRLPFLTLLILRRIQVTELLIMHFLQPLVNSSLSSLNILLNTEFSNALDLFSSLKLKHSMLHPYRTTRITLVLYKAILISKFLDSQREKDSEVHGSKHSPNLLVMSL